MTTTAPLKPAIDLLAKVKASIPLEDWATTENPLETNPIDQVLLRIYWRAHGLFDAVSVLIGNGLLEEAGIIARSLYEESLWLMEAERAGEGRKQLVLGWMRVRLDDIIGLYKEAAASGLADGCDAVIETLEGQKDSISAAHRRHGVGRLRTFPPVKQLAKLHGRESEYLDYLMNHHLVHGTPLSHTLRQEFVEDQLRVYTRSSDVRVGLSMAVNASLSILYSYTAISRIMGVPISREALETLHYVKRVDDRIMAWSMEQRSTDST